MLGTLGQRLGHGWSNAARDAFVDLAEGASWSALTETLTHGAGGLSAKRRAVLISEILPGLASWSTAARFRNQDPLLDLRNERPELFVRLEPIPGFLF
jgi:hypothetical protein